MDEKRPWAVAAALAAGLASAVCLAWLSLPLEKFIILVAFAASAALGLGFMTIARKEKRRRVEGRRHYCVSPN
jgi:hypothetical protein